jgi:hypothetical protein
MNRSVCNWIVYHGYCYTELYCESGTNTWRAYQRDQEYGELISVWETSLASCPPSGAWNLIGGWGGGNMSISYT